MSLPASPQDNPPFSLFMPDALAYPILISSPHSGRSYPQSFLAASAQAPLTLRGSEDAFVDLLWEPAAAQGVPLLRAHFPRAYLDLNRNPHELDPQMFDAPLPVSPIHSLRLAAGLGVIPRVVGNGWPIYRAPLTVADALERLATLHAPYHTQLAQMIEDMRQRFGLCVLIDAHSMPSYTPNIQGCDIVLGDRHGTSADAAIVEIIEHSLTAAGLIVRRNKPYAGGYIIEHHGAPAKACHAIQIEINRALYLDEDSLNLRPEATSLARTLSTLITNLGTILSRQ